MPTRAKQYSPEVLAEAHRMANSTATAMVYEYELVDAPVGDNLLGITYVGQSCEPCMAPNAALIDRDQKHVREAKSHPCKQALFARHQLVWQARRRSKAHA